MQGFRVKRNQVVCTVSSNRKDGCLPVDSHQLRVSNLISQYPSPLVAVESQLLKPSRGTQNGLR